MIRGVDASWLRDRLDEPGLTVIDPRSRMRYLSGHAPRALSVPVQETFAEHGRLVSDDELVSWLGRRGVAAEGTAVVYADADGQPGAMLAWILEYLGHPDVRFVTTRFERWRDEGGELVYRPMVATPTTFEAKPKRELRATWEVVESGRVRLLDTRTPEEFSGERVMGDEPPGHIPGALNLPWLSFQAEDDNLFLAPTEVAARLREAGATPGLEVVVYCRSGQRAAVAWLAIHLAGAPVRLYDGSFLDWSSRRDLPIEAGVREKKTAR
ncbi:MAG: sulfurtransferase [Chloroflexota bacterium]